MDGRGGQRQPRDIPLLSDCGTTIAYVDDIMPGMIAIPVGCFADPDFPAPTVSVFEERRHA